MPFVLIKSRDILVKLHHGGMNLRRAFVSSHSTFSTFYTFRTYWISNLDALLFCCSQLKLWQILGFYEIAVYFPPISTLYYFYECSLVTQRDWAVTKASSKGNRSSSALYQLWLRAQSLGSSQWLLHGMKSCASFTRFYSLLSTISHKAFHSRIIHNTILRIWLATIRVSCLKNNSLEPYKNRFCSIASLINRIIIALQLFSVDHPAWFQLRNQGWHK